MRFGDQNKQCAHNTRQANKIKASFNGLSIYIYNSIVLITETTFMNDSELNQTYAMSYGTISSMNSNLRLTNIKIKNSWCYAGCALYLQNSYILID